MNKPTTLYAALRADGAEIDHHESDLYVRDTPEVRAVLDRYPLQKSNAQRFQRATASRSFGQVWIDIPFAYDPWWEARGVTAR